MGNESNPSADWAFHLELDETIHNTDDDIYKEIESFDIGNIQDKETKLTDVSTKVKEYEDIENENKTIKIWNKDLKEEEKLDWKNG